jgi:hypothetical protein
VTQLIERVKVTPRQPGVDDIRIPSERAFRSRARALHAGLEIDRVVFDARRPARAVRSAGVAYLPICGSKKIPSSRIRAARARGLLSHTVSTVEPTVLRDSRSRCACAASFSG